MGANYLLMQMNYQTRGGIVTDGRGSEGDCVWKCAYSGDVKVRK
jgi:hypothetical protein